MPLTFIDDSSLLSTQCGGHQLSLASLQLTTQQKDAKISRAVRPPCHIYKRTHRHGEDSIAAMWWWPSHMEAILWGQERERRVKSHTSTSQIWQLGKHMDSRDPKWSAVVDVEVLPRKKKYVFLWTEHHCCLHVYVNIQLQPHHFNICCAFLEECDLADHAYHSCAMRF